MSTPHRMTQEIQTKPHSNIPSCFPRNNDHDSITLQWHHHQTVWSILHRVTSQLIGSGLNPSPAALRPSTSEGQAAAQLGSILHTFMQTHTDGAEHVSHMNSGLEKNTEIISQSVTFCVSFIPTQTKVLKHGCGHACKWEADTWGRRQFDPKASTHEGMSSCTFRFLREGEDGANISGPPGHPGVTLECVWRRRVGSRNRKWLSAMEVCGELMAYWSHGDGWCQSLCDSEPSPSGVYRASHTV